jgi:hypothetical protein
MAAPFDEVGPEIPTDWLPSNVPFNPNKVVTLFLPSGETFTFRDVIEIKDTERELFLTYRSVSDGRDARLEVRKPAIVGFSVKSA